MTNATNWIAYRFLANGAMYVESLPAGGGDYGYTTDASKALPLTDSQWRAFASYMRHCNSVAYCVPAA